MKSLIGETAKNPTVLGYYVSDEPSARDFPALAKAVAAVKKHAPGKLAYINLFPTYSTLEALKSRLGTKSYEEYLERFVQEVKPQLISYDNYSDSAYRRHAKRQGSRRDISRTCCRSATSP